MYPKMTCSESREIVKKVSLEQSVETLHLNELAAVQHYLECKQCRDLGLQEIHEHKMTCQEALLIWAKTPGALWHDCSVFYVFKNIGQLYAVEHVWGNYQHENEMGGSGFEHRTACHQKCCIDLYSHWKSIPMSTSAGDGPKGVIYQLKRTFEIFQRADWKLDPIIEVMRDRVKLLESKIDENSVGGVADGHYHELSELQEELRVVSEVLGKLA